MKLSIIAILISLSTQAFARPAIPLQKDVDPPELLSQTGIFKGDVSLLQPADGARSYEIIQPLFVDFAVKQRMFFLPENTSVAFSPTGAYGFPVGTILVKHFRMETSKGVFQNLETRVLVRKEGESAQNFVGYTYKWEGNDARLVDANSSPEILLTIDATAEGGAREQKFKIPNRRQCLQCHNSSVGFVRSLETLQLNRLVNGVNQLEQLNAAGIFGHDIGPVNNFDSYAAIDDESSPLEKRVRSYVAVNCSHCHNPDPAAMCSFTGLDFRFDKMDPAALIVSGHIVKGAKDQSEIYNRMNSTAPGYRMPFIGSVLKDEKAVSAVGRWIDGL